METKIQERIPANQKTLGDKMSSPQNKITNVSSKDSKLIEKLRILEIVSIYVYFNTVVNRSLGHSPPSRISYSRTTAVRISELHEVLKIYFYREF
jgi:hypothetical protein